VRRGAEAPAPLDPLQGSSSGIEQISQLPTARSACRRPVPIAFSP